MLDRNVAPVACLNDFPHMNFGSSHPCRPHRTARLCGLLWLRSKRLLRNTLFFGGDSAGSWRSGFGNARNEIWPCHPSNLKTLGVFAGGISNKNPTSSRRMRGLRMKTRQSVWAVALASFPASADDGWYGDWHSDAQAEKGHQLFNTYCAQCHRPDLSGRSVRLWSGQDFSRRDAASPWLIFLPSSTTRCRPRIRARFRMTSFGRSRPIS